MPLTVTVKIAAVTRSPTSVLRCHGDSKNRAGMVITDGDVAADAGADDLMLKELTPASASQSMTTTGIVLPALPAATVRQRLRLIRIKAWVENATHGESDGQYDSSRIAGCDFYGTYQPGYG